MPAKQLSFLPKIPKEHGGSSRIGKRKTQRPFDPKRPLHLSLKSSLARGQRSMLAPKNKGQVLECLHRAQSANPRVKILRFANVGNHLHLLIQAKSRREFQAFLREFAGRLASAMTGAIKGRPEKFWDTLAWSKVLEWGRQYQSVARYILLNVLKSFGRRDRALLAKLEQEGIVFIQDA
jgi:hypothetical protein